MYRLIANIILTVPLFRTFIVCVTAFHHKAVRCWGENIRINLFDHLVFLYCVFVEMRCEVCVHCIIERYVHNLCELHRVVSNTCKKYCSSITSIAQSIELGSGHLSVSLRTKLTVDTLRTYLRRLVVVVVVYTAAVSSTAWDREGACCL